MVSRSIDDDIYGDVRDPPSPVAVLQPYGLEL